MVKFPNRYFKTTTSAYRYDNVGNRTYDAETVRYTVADEGDIIEGTYHYNTYNKLNQLVTVNEVCAKTANNNYSSKTYVTRYKYDARGNKKEEVDGKSGDITTYAYDVENQLVDVKVNNKLVQHNEYNGVGQRIKKVESIDSESEDETKTTNYFYEGSILLYTTNEQGEKTSQNIIGNASNTFATIRYNDGQKEYFYSKDVQGSTTNITASNGDCVNSYDYTDFGETSEKIASTVANEICYTGGVYDKTTELYYLNARYYDPEDGVFMSQDTYRGTDTDVASWNLYGYCEGNPVNYVDPSGHECAVITITQFKGESRRISDIIARYYDTSSKIYKANSKKKFKNIWNKLTNKKIECVVINSHANPNCLATKTKEILNKGTIKKLKRKRIKRLIVLGCNAGHQNYKKSNIANKLTKKIKGSVIASDGTVYSNGSNADDYSTFNSKNDKEWKYWRNQKGGTRKKNKGWVKYLKYNSVKILNKKNATISDLCSM